MRWLVLALLMLNILYALWAVLRPASAPTAHDAGGGHRFVEPLVLVQEMDQPPLVIERPPAVCLALGPFGRDDEARDFAAAHLAGRDWRISVDAQELPPMHRVYLPPPDAGPAGTALLVSVRDAIDAAGLDIDSYLVVGGDLDGVVSLGLFAGQGNARNVYGQVAGLGLAVEMQTENRTRSRYSIVLAGDEDPDFIQESVVALQAWDAAAGITEKLCEMIALPD